MAESADERLPFENLSIRDSHSNYIYWIRLLQCSRSFSSHLQSVPNILGASSEKNLLSRYVFPTSLSIGAFSGKYNSSTFHFELIKQSYCHHFVLCMATFNLFSSHPPSWTWTMNSTTIIQACPIEGNGHFFLFLRFWHSFVNYPSTSERKKCVYGVIIIDILHTPYKLSNGLITLANHKGHREYSEPIKTQ